jgi:predicted ArsR family transcriptional regulator
VTTLKRPPLTARAHAALKKYGPATTDAVARRVRAKSHAVSKALSKLKARGLTAFTVRSGEAVWRAKRTAKD